MINHKKGNLKNSVQIAYLVQPAIQSPKALHLLSWMTKKQQILIFRSWNQLTFDFLHYGFIFVSKVAGAITHLHTHRSLCARKLFHVMHTDSTVASTCLIFTHSRGRQLDQCWPRPSYDWSFSSPNVGREPWEREWCHLRSLQWFSFFHSNGGSWSPSKVPRS